MKRTLRHLLSIISISSASIFAFTGAAGLIPANAMALSAAVYEEENKAPEFESADYDYRVNSDGTVTIKAYTGSKTDAVIPAELDGHPVSAIGEDAFSNQVFTSLIIPSEVKLISDRAFQYCKVTSSFLLPDGIQIRDRAFEYASLPDTIMIPAGSVVEGSSFSYCKELKKLFIAHDASLRDNAFSYSKKLTSIVCAGGSDVAGNAFNACSMLKEAVMCGDVKLEDGMFPEDSGVKIIKAAEEEFDEAIKKAQEPAVRAGVINGNTYVNESLMLSCTLPDDWMMATTEDIAAMMELTIEEFQGAEILESFLESHENWTDMLALTADAENISVLVSRIPDDLAPIISRLSMNEYASFQKNSVIAIMEASGYSDIIFEIDETYEALSLNDYACICISAVYDGAPVYIRELLYPVDEYIVTVTAGSFGEDNTVEYLGFFE